MRLPGSLTLEEKIAQLFVLRVYGTTAHTTNPDDVRRNHDAYGLDNAAAVVQAYQPGGVVYFRNSGNVENPVQLAELSNGIQRAALDRPAPDPIPVMISADQEGGRVARLSPPLTWFPAGVDVARLGDGAAGQAAAVMATELRAVGVRHNYAPVGDVHLHADNQVIGDRSFGSDPSAVAKVVTAQVRAFQSAGVAATVKHFPGHGDTAADTHTDRAVITHSRSQWETFDLPPFKAAIDAGVDSVMVGHLVFPALDATGAVATTSQRIVTGLLREELGFDGVVVTDGMGMRAIRLAHPDVDAPLHALRAGVDQILTPVDGTFPKAVERIRRAVDAGELTVERIDASVERILRLKARIGLFEDPYADVDHATHVVGSRAHQQTARRITQLDP